MHELYQVLGVRSGAADEEIKAAFRCLAKQLHPDLHPGDGDAERRLRDVITAYETLIDPPSRAAYDAGLARQRSLRRWRFRSKATTMLAAFALTVSLGLFWRQLGDALLPAGAYPPRVSASDTVAARKSEAVAASPSYGVSTNVAVESADAAAIKSPKANAESSSAPGPAELVRLLRPKAVEALPDPANRGLGPQRPDEATVPPSSPALGKTHGWAGYQNTVFGFTLQYPADVFVPEPERPGDGQSFLSRDGHARLVISGALNTSGITPAKHRRSLMDGPYSGAAFDYAPQRGSWFVLSGTLGNEMFYQRVTFACDGQAFHTWRLVYPVSERAFYDRIVEEVHRRYRHAGGDERRCG